MTFGSLEEVERWILSWGEHASVLEPPAQVRQIVGSGLEKERIRTSCLGFGNGYNEDLLDRLAKAASGALHDAASPEKFPAIFRQELESLLEIELAYDEITEGGITSKTEQRTIRLVAVQDPADVRVNEQAVEWVAAQEVGRTISEAMAERDRGDLDAVRRRLRATKDKLDRYGCAESTGRAIENLKAFEAAAEEWGPRARKTSRTFSTRSRKTSSYYKAEAMGDPSIQQPPQVPPQAPDKPNDPSNPPKESGKPPARGA